MLRFAPLLVTLLLLIPGIGSAAAPADTALDQALRTAEHQRMLTQRVVKAYAMLGQQVNTSEAELQLAEAVALFELQHQDLVAASPNAQVTDALTRTNAAWSRVTELTTTVPKRAEAWRLSQLADRAMGELTRVIYGLQQAASSVQGQLVQVAGNQQTLSQRLAALYLLKAWGIENPGLDEEYRVATVAFAQGLEQLMASSRNTRRIRVDLKRVKAQWRMFQRSADLHDDEYVPLLVNGASDRILRLMDEVTTRYSDLAAAG